MAAAAPWAIRASIWKWATKALWNAPIATSALSLSRAQVIIERPQEGGSSLSGRWLGLSVPRLSRLAAFDPQVGRPAGRRGVRLLQHAVEAAGGYEGRRSAHPSGGDFRRRRKDLPQ